jgi:hypothetical protein
MPKRTKIEETGRVHATIPPDLKAWAQEYAKRKRTNISRMIAEHFEALRRKEASAYIEETVGQI